MGVRTMGLLFRGGVERASGFCLCGCARGEPQTRHKVHHLLNRCGLSAQHKQLAGDTSKKILLFGDNYKLRKELQGDYKEVSHHSSRFTNH